MRPFLSGPGGWRPKGDGWLEHHGFDRQRRHDAARDAVLAMAGLRVIRFWNHETDTNIDGVVETIMAAAEAGLAAYRSEHPRMRGQSGSPERDPDLIEFDSTQCYKRA